MYKVHHAREVWKVFHLHVTRSHHPEVVITHEEVMSGDLLSSERVLTEQEPRECVMNQMMIL